MRATNVRRIYALAVLVLVSLAAAGLGQAEQESVAALKARLKKLDSGPKTLDVAKYPKDMQAGYALFEKKCAKCHSPARAINSGFVLPGEWERYIKRMVFKPDSKMTETDGKAIYRFLAYDSSVRKAESLRAHLASLTPEEREAAIAKIKTLNPAFEPAGK